MKKFEKPEIELVRFDAEDIITTSADPNKVPLDDKGRPVVPETDDPSLSTDFHNVSWNFTPSDPHQ